MSSDSGESHVTADNEERGTSGAPVEEPFGEFVEQEESNHGGVLTKEVIEEEQQHVRDELRTGVNGGYFARHTTRHHEEEGTDDGTEVGSGLPIRQRAQTPGSPESTSIPDDTPSIQGSILSSPSVPTSHASFSRMHHPAALQPFERRFSSRLTPSPLHSPRVVSPAFLNTRSRQSSVASTLLYQQSEADTPQAPWEVVRWTKLKKMTGQIFSEVGKRNFGRPNCLAVAASIVVGTSKGFVLVFDYNQVLKSIIGPGTKAIECGPVTSLAISADHSTIAGGHATGNIFTWELARPAKPFLHIPPTERDALDGRRSDGHVADNAVLHIGFLGTRHTALVSADDGGMAFSHLATRGLGAVARTVKTTRILGRYPLTAKSTERPRKPSSVLAFAPLPLGNVEQPTDNMGLTALLTPYLLVIVSTTPLAQTQHKASRPKEIAPHSTLSGCLAWFPAVKLKNASGNAQQQVSKTKLVYCWSNILTILDVDAIPIAEKEKPPELTFKPRSRWRGEEAIVAIQWLSRSVLGVLTISQRLIILEDTSLRITDSFDLLQKHIYHEDLFSKQLQPVVEQLDEDDVSMHGVVADAFHMSFRAYKGRLFILGFNDISIGTLSNWADRLLAFMEDGDFIAAIGLATSYYNGDADKLTVGLPEDHTARHKLVQEKLLDMMAASLKYTFARKPNVLDKDTREKQLTDLAEVCFTGCLSMKEQDFLFEEIYDAYEEGSAEDIFFQTLEPYILEEEITAVPPNVLKDLITYYASSNRAKRLEEMLCRLNTLTMDIDQVTTLCQQYNLYDALIYVWTQALHDYITPLINILTLIKVVEYDTTDDQTENVYVTSAMKIFPYLAYIFTSRVYPSGTFMDEVDANQAKRDLYSYLFSGKALDWPKGSGEVLLTRSDKGQEPSFPYLRMILSFDTGSFMSMLNEAFEDSYLNGEQDSNLNGNGTQTNGTQQASSFTPTRRYIINVLLEDIIYFYMFLARNLPKYPQHIILPGTSLHKILIGLCNYPTDVVKDDCQLSVEYLLSIYHPPDLQSLVPLFEQAGFHRVLKSVYKSSQQYAKLLEAHLNDTESRESVFECISDCMRPSRGLNKKQMNEVKAVIVRHARELASIDAFRTAKVTKQYTPDLLRDVLDALEDESESQYQFLRAIIEPEEQSKVDSHYLGEGAPSGFAERYVQLMCKYNSTHVADFVSILKSGDLRLSSVLPALEKSGVVDAAVVLMARDGLVKDAMDRLVKHLGTLEIALTSLIKAAADSPDAANTEEAVGDLLASVEKYSKVGIWLCQGQTRSMERNSTNPTRLDPSIADTEETLAIDELLWLDLVDTVVSVTKTVSSAASSLPTAPNLDPPKITTPLRATVQQTFSALLASTAATPKPTTSPSPTRSRSRPRHHQHPSFLRILRAFLTRAAASAPSLRDLRAVLADIFAAYAFEDTLLALATRFLDKDAFAHVAAVHALRQRGWRPRGQVCEACRRRAWGPGAGGDIWDAWARRGEREEERRGRSRGGSEVRRREERGKGRARVGVEEEEEESESGREEEEGRKEEGGPLVVFACRHLWHRRCLVRAMDEGKEEGGEGRGGKRRFKCPICA
ncbi:uncharacterized protein BDZ99DRAFT_510898 [Mytilinidion resinicola]|uniref:Vacuolar protein sorting-associated protein 8 central domain-containing protein n=1 Tax=Mytilinidion resinicola TaxID=574789 RepID=A0A6A6YBL3_9PEZI|nr:uncharacterized protein BDZ99DRAFT_510898 [Mytilinidion resinicola]KAF2805968.1 hypothetical protein BDZ99DRAFT_510898 [Mytilinidion resinicola]